MWGQGSAGQFNEEKRGSVSVEGPDGGEPRRLTAVRAIGPDGLNLAGPALRRVTDLLGVDGLSQLQTTNPTPFDLCRRTAREDCLITSREKVQFFRRGRTTRCRRGRSGTRTETNWTLAGTPRNAAAPTTVAAAFSRVPA